MAHLGDDGGSTDDGVQGVRLGAHQEVEVGEAALQALPVLLCTPHRVHEHLPPRRTSRQAALPSAPEQRCPVLRELCAHCRADGESPAAMCVRAQPRKCGEAGVPVHPAARLAARPVSRVKLHRHPRKRAHRRTPCRCHETPGPASWWTPRRTGQGHPGAAGEGGWRWKEGEEG